VAGTCGAVVVTCCWTIARRANRGLRGCDSGLRGLHLRRGGAVLRGQSSDGVFLLGEASLMNQLSVCMLWEIMLSA